MVETNTVRNDHLTKPEELCVENSQTKQADQKNDKHELGPQGTMMFDSGQVDQLIAGAIARQQSKKAQVPALVGISEGFSGTKLILEESTIVVGRDTDCDFVLREPSVSAMHSKLVKKDEGWKVMNMLSSNGTYVNDMKCHEAVLKAGDRVRFGRVEFLFSYVSKEEQRVKDHKKPKAPSFWLGIIASGLFFAILFAILYWL